MVEEKNDIKWDETEDRENIRWGEITDNLKVFEVEENEFIDLGNPFEGGPPPPPPPSSSRNRVPKVCLAFNILLILMVAFFFSKCEYTDSIVSMSEAWEVKQLLEIEYSLELESIQHNSFVEVNATQRDELKLIQYKLSIEVNATHWDRPVKMDIDDIYICEITNTDRKKEITPFNFDKNERFIFYCDSHLFGRKIISSSEIFKPSLGVEYENGSINVINNSSNRIFLLDIPKFPFLLRPGKSYMIKLEDYIMNRDTITLSGTDFNTNNEFKIMIRLKVHRDEQSNTENSD